MMSERVATSQPASRNSRERLGQLLDAAAFCLVLLAVAIRPLLSETYESSLGSVVRAVASFGDTTPATTAWLDLAIWSAMVAACVAAMLDKRRWRITGVEIGAGLLIVAAVVSTVAASNKRLAVNASANWLTSLAVVVVVANLCRDRMRIGLLLAALSASGLASMARCTMQKTTEFAETRQQYEQQKDKFWADQNVSLDDPRVELYERRLKAAEANGFLPLSNTQGAWLSLAGFSMLGLRGLVVRRRWLAHALFVPAALAFAMILWTGSKGALVAAGGALIAWGMLSFIQEELRPRWRLALLTGWLGLVGLVSVGAAYGAVKGGLPGDSLRFRWNYWQVTRDIIAASGRTGVGAMNFDKAYLAFKPVEFPEEIRDPHNFLLSITAQWGLLGGVGLAAVLLGASIMMTRIWAQREPTDTPPPVYDPQARYLGLQWIVAIAAGFFWLRLWLMRGWLGDTHGIAYVFFDLGLYGMVWMVGFAALSWVTRGGVAGDLDYCQLACLAGVLAFVLHGLIDVAMFYPGTLLPMAALGGLLLVAREGGPAHFTCRPWLPATAAVVLTVGLVVLVIVPVTRTASLLSRARFLSMSMEQLSDIYREAIAADPLDPTAPAEYAELLALQPGQDLQEAVRAIDVAVDRDLAQISLYRARATLLEASWRRTGSSADLIRALGSARAVLLLYPSSPDDHVWLADLLVRMAGDNRDPDLLDEAIADYSEALDLDADRASGEIRRWSPSRRQAVIEKMRLLTEASTSPAK